MKDFLSFRGWIAALADLFLPRSCVVCGKALSLRERHICLECLADLPRTYYSGMARNPLADRFNALVQRRRDREGLPGFEAYSYATALFFYRSGTGYRNITKRLKYHAGFACGRYFSRMLAEEMAASGLYAGVDAVIPVPLHWTRRLSRGYNQAEVIAGVLAAGLGAEVRTGILRRRRRTRTQTRLGVEGKMANVSGAFRVRKRGALSGYSHILLVDDVFTTGATLHSCHEAIRAEVGENTRISVAALACVGS